MANTLRTRLEAGESLLSNLNGGRPVGTNNGAVLNGLTPVNDTFANGTYIDTLVAAGATNPGRAIDPSAGPARQGGI